MADTFRVTYRLTLSDGESPEERIRTIQLEQSAELPEEVVRAMDIDRVTGSVIHQESEDDNHVLVTISWPSQNHGNEITQFLNILFGNISLKQGIAITNICWEDVSPDLFKGPAWGISRIRKEWDIPSRALSCTALKPLGYTSRQLSDLAYRFALGGMDIIKDDHGITQQQTAPFRERVTACVSAVERAAQKTGRRSHYFPNITSEPHLVPERYEIAADLGADGVLFSPMLAGPALMHYLARSATDLPIMAHPAFSGTMVAYDPAAKDGLGKHGFAAGLLYGGLWRALGADFVIYPNAGGRFSYTPEMCNSINYEARRPDSPFAPCFPTPGGGMQKDKMVRWLDNYGHQTTFLIGGSLYENPEEIESTSKTFMQALL